MVLSHVASSETPDPIIPQPKIPNINSISSFCCANIFFLPIYYPTHQFVGRGAVTKTSLPNWFLIWSIKKARVNYWEKGKKVVFPGPRRKRRDRGEEKALPQVLKWEAHNNNVRSWVAGNGGLHHPWFAEIC